MGVRGGFLDFDDKERAPSAGTSVLRSGGANGERPYWLLLLKEYAGYEDEADEPEEEALTAFPLRFLNFR